MVLTRNRCFLRLWFGRTNRIQRLGVDRVKLKIKSEVIGWRCRAFLVICGLCVCVQCVCIGRRFSIIRPPTLTTRRKTYNNWVIVTIIIITKLGADTIRGVYWVSFWGEIKLSPRKYLGYYRNDYDD